ncbi:hypothetical protein EIK80_06380 [Caulobacter sp. 602-1]|nr:hypothetical protein EIK80_06380 [Caulobacter sp. 602-1]
MTQSVFILGQGLVTALCGSRGRPGSPFPHVNTPALPQNKSAIARGGMGRKAADNKEKQGVRYEKRPHARGLGPRARHRGARLRANHPG